MTYLKIVFISDSTELDLCTASWVLNKLLMDLKPRGEGQSPAGFGEQAVLLEHSFVSFGCREGL